MQERPVIRLRMCNLDQDNAPGSLFRMLAGRIRQKDGKKTRGARL
jgi:hypothetical protein